MKLSNNVILGFLVIALLISGIATVINLNRLLSTSSPFELSGAATGTATGTTTLNITSSTSISNRVSTINFGTGYADANCTSCVMDSHGVSLNRACCVSFNNVSTGFVLENTGNINLSINYTCAGNCTAALFIGGTTPLFKIKTTANNAAGYQFTNDSTTDTLASCNNAWSITSYANVGAAGEWLCGNATNYPLDFTNTYDAGVIDLNVTIPIDTPTGGGVKTATFTFNAFSSG